MDGKVMLLYLMLMYQSIAVTVKSDDDFNYNTQPCYFSLNFRRYCCNFMSCITTYIDRNAAFVYNLKNPVCADCFCELQLSSSKISDHCIIQSDALEDWNKFTNITVLLLKAASIGRINRKAFVGTKLIQFIAVQWTYFVEFSFEPLEEVSNTLQTIVIDSPILTVSSLQPLILHSAFHKLQNIFIRNMAFTFEIGFKNLSSLETIEIIYNPNLQNIPSGSLLQLHKLTNLTLSRNSLEEIPPDVKNIQSLQLLDLSFNQISDINNFDDLSNLPSLKEVYFNGNKIIMVSQDATNFLQKADKGAPPLLHLKRFFLGYNPFNCSCDLQPFAVWLKDTHVDVGLKHISSSSYLIPYSSPGLVDDDDDDDDDDDGLVYKCAYPPDPIGVSVLSLTNKNCTLPDGPNGNEEFWNLNTITIIVSVGLFFLIGVGVVSGGMIYRKIGRRQFAGLFPILDNGKDDEDVIYEFLHDAYVCHHDNLTEFVVYNLMPRLEQDPYNFDLCLSFRDFIVGEDKLDNITKAFETCCTTIFLIDNDFVNSNQCMLELKICCSYLLDDTRPAHSKQRGLILIVMDAIQRDLMPTTLRVLMDKVTYLEWDRLDDEPCCMQLITSLQTLIAQARPELDNLDHDELHLDRLGREEPDQLDPDELVRLDPVEPEQVDPDEPAEGLGPDEHEIN